MTLRFKPLHLLFVLFLAVAMVRIVPFSPRNLLDVNETDQIGGLPRQIAFVVLFLGIVVTVVRSFRLSDLALPLSFLALLGFAALSISWSVAPVVGTRRLALTLVVTFVVLLATSQLRPRDSLDLLRRVTVGLAVVTLLAGVVYPHGAIHQAGDPEPAIIGAWRGIFYHKNHAGIAIGLGVVLAADAAMRDRRILSFAMLLLAVAALALTRSKTSAIAAGVAVAMLLVFRGAILLGGRNRAQAALMRWGFVLGASSALLLAWFATDLQYYVLDPDAFTGRGQLWGVIIELIRKRPLLGYGYESVFQAGETGIMTQMSGLHWIQIAPHSHNGVLDLLVTTGGVGLALYAWALFVDPWRRLGRLPEDVRDAWQPILAALLCYAFVQSLMEGKSFSGDSLQWTILVLVVGISTRLTSVVRETAPQSLQGRA